uniref:Uncharacterized protein n=1 Tax=Oryza nivara TaxID=4536 RepID=A0A0E0IVZ9_ORYNI
MEGRHGGGKPVASSDLATLRSSAVCRNVSPRAPWCAEKENSGQRDAAARTTTPKPALCAEKESYRLGRELPLDRELDVALCLGPNLSAKKNSVET